MPGMRVRRDLSVSPRRRAAALATTAALAALVAAPLVAEAATPVTVDWSTARELSDAGQNAYGPDVTTSADGTRLTAVWWRSDGTNHRVQASSSTDAGANWTMPKTLSAAGQNARGPQVAASADGTRLTAVWWRSDGTNDRIQASASTDAGATWTIPRTLSEAGQDASYPQITTSADGTRLAAVWQRWDGSKLRIQASASTDAGATWTIPRTLSEAGQDASLPQITTSADGTRLAAVWQRWDGSKSRIQASASSTGGTAWSSPQTLSEPGANAFYSQVVTSADGTSTTAVWERSDGTNPRVQASSSTDAGATWGIPATLSAAGHDAQHPEVAASADGTRLGAVWYRSDGTNDRVQASSSTDGGASWSSPATLSEPGQNARFPRIASSVEGTRLGAVWWRSDGTNVRVQASASADGGVSWSSPATLSAPDQHADSQQVAASADGTRTTAVWSRSDGSHFRIQAAAGSLSTVPGAPGGVVAKPGPRKATVSWSPPADDGNSPLTGYTATATPGGQGCVTSGTACTITGLTNRTAYTVTVTATNALGTGPTSSPVSVTPAPKAVTIAKAASGRSRLKVRVKPNLGPRKQWTFTVEKRVGATWQTLKTNAGNTKVYKTRGANHIRILNLPQGRYQARSRAAHGYLPDTSRIVKLER